MRILRSVALATPFLGLLAFTPGNRVATINLYNESDYVVTHVYIGPCEDEWEEVGDLLDADEVLAPGDAVGAEIEAGCWDFRAVVENDEVLDSHRMEFEDGDELEWTISNGE